MSKLAIILCAILIASAANIISGYVLDTTQNNAQQQINVAIAQIVEKREFFEKWFHEAAENITSKTNKIHSDVLNNIVHITRETADEIAELKVHADDVNVSGCGEMSYPLANKANAVIDRFGVCIEHESQRRLDYINGTSKDCHNAYETLIQLREKSKNCGANTREPESHTSGISCDEAAGINATSISDKFNGNSEVWISNVTSILGSLEASLAECQTKSGFYAYEHESRNAIHNIEKCIETKIIENSNPTTKYKKCPKGNYCPGRQWLSSVKYTTIS